MIKIGVSRPDQTREGAQHILEVEQTWCPPQHLLSSVNTPLDGVVDAATLGFEGWSCATHL